MTLSASGDGFRAERAALVTERRGTRGDAEPVHPYQHVQQFLGDAVREILVVLVVAHVDERQHGDRSAGRLGVSGRLRDGRPQCLVPAESLAAPAACARTHQNSPPPSSNSTVRIVNSRPLTRCCPRSPWYQASTNAMGSPTRNAMRHGSLQLPGPLEHRAEVSQPLQQAPRAGHIGDAPLHHLAAAQAGPQTLSRLFDRFVQDFPLCGRSVDEPGALSCRSQSRAGSARAWQRRLLNDRQSPQPRSSTALRTLHRMARKARMASDERQADTIDHEHGIASVRDAGAGRTSPATPSRPCDLCTEEG